MDKQTQSAIEKLVHDPKWSFVKKIALDMIQEMRGKSVPKNSNWELTSEALIREGKAIGITKFIQKLDETANTIRTDN